MDTGNPGFRFRGENELKSRARILVVDDEELLRRMLRQILLREGYGAVVGVSDGETALARLRQERFDIMITDVRMPLMSGLELLVQVKQEFPKISVIVMTGFGDIHTPDEAKNLGADEYVTKPFKAREIEVIVERVRMRQIVSGRAVHRTAAAS